LYDLLDMYDNQAAQAKLDSMKADELYRHVALQGGLTNSQDITHSSSSSRELMPSAWWAATAA
jgi:hypothetical protein